MTTALQTLQQVFGYASFRDPQDTIIHHVTNGGHALVLMPTGGGKSLCYQIPALLRPGLTLVISPLIALMQDQVGALQRHGIPAACLNSTQGAAASQALLRQIGEGRLKLLYVSPERLSQPGFLALLQQWHRDIGLGLFAIDEAHCIAEWGHDFRPEYRQLCLLHQHFPQVPRIALTATADPQTREEIISQLRLQEGRQFISSFDRKNLGYCIHPKDNPWAQITSFLQHRHPHHSGILYCQSRRQVECMAQWLQHQGWPAVPYHAGLSMSLREAHQSGFLASSCTIMVATIAFGMGVDKPDVRFVIHLQSPKNLESYYQETGRAGRDGMPAEALLLFHRDDLAAQQSRLDHGHRSRERKDIEQRRLDALGAFCLGTGCRRQALLGYFGEAHSGYCGQCDCCNPAFQHWSGPRRRHHAVTFAPDHFTPAYRRTR